MTRYHHLDRAAQRLQQRSVRLQRLVLGCDVLLGCCGAALLATLLAALAGWTLPSGIFYGILGGLAVSIFAILAWRIQSDTMGALARADKVLGLHAALSTAYEYLQQHATHPFVPALMTVAERYAHRVEARRVLPLQLPPRVWGIPVLIAATLSCSFFHISPWQFDTAHEPEAVPQVAREGQRLEKWGRELEELARREQLDRSMILARQIQQLGQRMQREGGEPGQVTERIATLSQYLQRLQQELRERALMSDSSGTLARDVRMSGKSVKQELRDLLQMLQQDTPARDTAALAEQSVQRLSRQIGQHPQLESLLQSLRSGDLDAARQMLRDVLEQQQATDDGEHLDRARRALEYSTRSIQRHSQGETSAGRSRPQPDASGQSPLEMGDEGMSSEQMSGMEDFQAPGAEDGVGSAHTTRQQAEVALRESEQPVSNVEVPSGEGPMRMSYIRSLPLPNEAQVPVENTVTQYQHAAEEVVAQEQIPRVYREHIKQYFLSLGIMK
ncbi:MAG: hypothetical protein FJZ47_02345 [Candidatus Tectomicrobia bacterium]|uniref:DUF4175 domain-containing protein n=1 Tax=Tectimicrobiota bacterium TaxID=2528274 RepID=A0A937VX20_UNCTE|nr:hypothetical protein [Candidatus Tectomicrobia bacterium]